MAWWCRPGSALAYPLVGTARSGAEEDWVGLQPHLTRLVGRVHESSRLHALIDRERLVTVIGTGGYGKAALAASVAHESARRGRTAGVALALAPVISIEQLVNALAALFGGGDGALVAVQRAPRIPGSCCSTTAGTSSATWRTS